MTPAEIDRLVNDLNAAGCPSLGHGVITHIPQKAALELRSLLQRPVWVARVSGGGWRREELFSRPELANQWLDKYRKANEGRTDAMKYNITTMPQEIDAEVPDGQG